MRPGLHLWRLMMHEIEMSTKNLIKSLISYHALHGYCLKLHWNCLAWLSVFLEALQNLSECSHQRCICLPKWGISQWQAACWLFYLQKLHPGSVQQPNCKLFKQAINCFVLNISLTPTGLVKTVRAPLKTQLMVNISNVSSHVKLAYSSAAFSGFGW